MRLNLIERRFSIADLCVAAGLIAIHLALAKVVAETGASALWVSVFALPLVLSAIIQFRLSLSWQTATLLHYPTAVFWSFWFGVAVSSFWRQSSGDWQQRESIGLVHPLEAGAAFAQAMCVAGIATTMVYAWASFIFASIADPMVER
ncbi:MAG: hypothetical protein F9B45_23605 [Phycisphaera sp. RhM]|nr:hypothetical protein [Phycisphaera sp. RhM]